MTDMIEALNIFLKYLKDTNARSVFSCSHDQIVLCYLSPGDVSQEDKTRLDALGWFVSEEDGEPLFMSFRFGSA